MGKPREPTIQHADLDRHARFMRFIVSGGFAAGLYFVFAYGLLLFDVQPSTAGLLAYALAFGIGYGLQQRWTFSKRHRHARALPRYLALQGFCALLAAGMLQLGTTSGIASPLAVSSVSTLVLGLVSYVVSSLWVFADE